MLRTNRNILKSIKENNSKIEQKLRCISEEEEEKRNWMNNKEKFYLFLEGYKLEALKNKSTAQKFIEQYPNKVMSNDVLEMARNGVSLSGENIDKLGNLIDKDVEVALGSSKQQ